MNQRFTILNPCPRKWAHLEGAGRSRYCDVCQTPVHAIAEYSPEEWNQLWREFNGVVCGFLACETATAPRSRRAVLIGALLTAVAPLWAQIGRVRIRVIDSTGAVVPRANVSLLGNNDRAIRTVIADERGEIVWTNLPLGDSYFLVNVPGFNSRRLNVTVRDANETQVQATLEIGTIGTVVSIELEPGQMPYSRLDLPPEPASMSPQAKRRWWQIFR